MLALLILLTTVNEPNVQQLAIHKVANEFRKSRGLTEQEFDPELAELAQQHADWMANGGGLNHGPNDQIIAYNYNGSFDGSVTQCMNQWTGSPPHAAWLYGSSPRVGWGYAVRGGQRFFAGVFRGGSPTTTTTTNYTTYRPRRRWFRPFRRRR